MMFGSYTIVPQRNLCLTDIALQFTRGIDDIIQRYIFPVEFPIGVIGNCIILLVLLSKENRTTPCLLLSAMAFSDIAYLFTLLPWWLASYGIFYRNRTFRLYFYIARMNVTAIANLFSAAANWLIMAVSLHRYTRTREPSRTRVRWPSWKSCCLIFAVFTLAAVVTSHNHIAYHVKIIPLCNRTQYAAVAHPVGPDRPMLAKWGSFMEFIVLLVMPIIVVSILCYLLYTGRRNRDISMTSANKLRTLDGETTPMIGEYGKERRESNKTRNSEQESIARQECLSEITVVAIGTCFVITHIPSAIHFVWKFVNNTAARNPLFTDIVSIANNMVVIEKIINFFLFYLMSRKFRKCANPFLGLTTRGHDALPAYDAGNHVLE